MAIVTGTNFVLGSGITRALAGTLSTGGRRSGTFKRPWEVGTTTIRTDVCHTGEGLAGGVWGAGSGSTVLGTRDICSTRVLAGSSGTGI